MAEPATTLTAGAAALLGLGAAANAASLIQGADAYLSLVDPAAGCTLDAEPFVLTKPDANADSPEADKNKKLRPEGGDATSRADTAKKKAPGPTDEPPKVDDILLIKVTNSTTTLDYVLGNFKDPIANLSLATWEVGDFVGCVPYLSHLEGFDSRIGNQVSFRCQSINQGPSAATIVTQVLYNPFTDESGYITCWHDVRLAPTLRVRALHIRAAPQSAFETRVYGGFSSDALIRPKR